jgi:hypothetical protein
MAPSLEKNTILARPPMTKTIVAISLLLPTALTARVGSAETPVDCESKTNGGDYYEIRCPLLSVGAAEWRFRARFTGVHDDSGAYMTVRVDGREIPCDAGSPIKLLGEGDEGGPGSDAFIECRLVTEGVPA